MKTGPLASSILRPGFIAARSCDIPNVDVTTRWSFMGGSDGLSKTYCSVRYCLEVVEIMKEGGNSIGVAIYENWTFLYSGSSNVKSAEGGQ